MSCRMAPWRCGAACACPLAVACPAEARACCESEGVACPAEAGFARDGEGAEFLPSSQTAWIVPPAPSAADSHPRAPVTPGGVIERAGANVLPPSVEAAARMPATP